MRGAIESPFVEVVVVRAAFTARQRTGLADRSRRLRLGRGDVLRHHGRRRRPFRGVSMARHLVPDLLAPGLDLVFCGTAPSPASYKARAYYANPGNAFWTTLNAVGLTPER